MKIINSLILFSCFFASGCLKKKRPETISLTHNNTLNKTQLTKKEETPTDAARKKAEEELTTFVTAQKKTEERAAQKAEAKRLAAEKTAQRAEAKRLAAEERAAQKAEAKRLAAEKAAQRAEAKRLAAEERAAQKAEAKRLAAEKAAQRAEANRLAAEERAAKKAEAKRLATEKAAQRAEAKRLAAEERAAKKAEAKRLAAEKAAQRAEANRLAKEKRAAKKAETERLAAEAEAAEIAEADRLAAEEEAAQKAEAIRLIAKEKIKNNNRSTDPLNREAQNAPKYKKGELYTFSIPIKNTTQNRLYVCCFAYAKKGPKALWQWHKSNVCRLDENETDSLKLTVFYENKRSINHIFAVLGVFNTLEEAENTSYELMPDKNKIDIDLLARIEGETIEIKIEKYGKVQSFYEYKTSREQTSEKNNTRTFTLENQTTRTINTCCFIYEDRRRQLNELDTASSVDPTRWRYYKSKIYTIPFGSSQEILLPSGPIDTEDDRQKNNEAIQCYLAVFGEKELNEAENTTFQTLENKNKLLLGTLDEIENSAIILNIDSYATQSDRLSFRNQTTRRINLENLHIRRKKKHL